MDGGVLKNNRARKLDSQGSNRGSLLPGSDIKKRNYRPNKRYFKTCCGIFAFNPAPHYSGIGSGYSLDPFQLPVANKGYINWFHRIYFSWIQSYSHCFVILLTVSPWFHHGQLKGKVKQNSIKCVGLWLLQILCSIYSSKLIVMLEHNI